MQLHIQPVVAVALVAKQNVVLGCRGANHAVGSQQIEIAVVVIIAPGGAIGEFIGGGDRAQCHAGKSAGTAVEVEKIGPSVAHEQIQIAVIVEVAPGAGFGIAGIRTGQQIIEADKGFVAEVAVEKILPVIGDEEIEIAVVVIIAPRRRVGVAAVGDDRPAGDAHDLDIGTALHDFVEQVVLAIIGHEEIRIAVVVEITPRLAARIKVALQQVLGENSRRDLAIEHVAAAGRKSGPPGGDEQIELVVAVEVDPGRAGDFGQIWIGNGSAGGIAEGAVAEVAQQLGAHARHQQIEIVVPLKIAPGRGERLKRKAAERGGGDIDKAAGAIVTVQAQLPLGGMLAGDRQIEIVIIVVIPPTGAGEGAFVAGDGGHGHHRKLRIDEDFENGVARIHHVVVVRMDYPHHCGIAARREVGRHAPAETAGVGRTGGNRAPAPAAVQGKLQPHVSGIGEAVAGPANLVHRAGGEILTAIGREQCQRHQRRPGLEHRAAVGGHPQDALAPMIIEVEGRHNGHAL